jgi:Na+-driven multidrug efflux pump
LEVELVRDEIEDHSQKLYKVEFVKILKMSGPVIFAYMLQNSLQTGSVLVVGRLVSLNNKDESDD